jgi:hypothetical protein
MLRSIAFVLPIALAAAWYAASTEAQLPVVAETVASDKFPFVVVESFDAKYEGDTPGHLGRHGGLGDRVPRVALGDAVYRGDGDAAKVVGKVTNLKWTRGQGALDIEFDPTDLTRIEIGDTVWLKLSAE